MVRHNGTTIKTVPLSYSGSPSSFAGEVDVSEAGTYEVIVYAYDPLTGNTGVDEAVVKVK